jgi:hypothetical protein
MLSPRTEYIRLVSSANGMFMVESAQFYMNRRTFRIEWVLAG